MAHKRASAASLSLLIAALAFAVAVPGAGAASGAAPGDLDPAFGSGGVVRTDLKQIEEATAATVAANGRIVVAGVQVSSSGTSRILLARYLPNGTLDSTFGTGGAVLDAIGKNPTAEARAVTIQSDGRIVVAGATSTSAPGTPVQNDTVVVRYQANGSRDPTFGTGGAVTVDLGNGTSDSARAVVVLADGRIVVAADAPGGKTEWTLDVLNADGSPSTTAQSAFSIAASPNALAVAPDGKIIAAGYATPAKTPDFAFARYLPNADLGLDTAFGSSGVTTVDFTAGDDEAFNTAVAPDGGVVASGFSSTPGGSTVGAVVKLTPAGVPDPRFGKNGRATVDFGTTIADAGAVALPGDGTVVVAGNADDGKIRRFAVARLTAAGALDPSFGQGGRVFTSFTGQDEAAAVRAVPGGDVVAVGSAGPASSSDLALAAYRTVATPTVTTAPATPTTAPSTTVAGGSTTTTRPRAGEVAPATSIPPAGGTTAAPPAADGTASGTPAAGSDSAAPDLPGVPRLLVSSARVTAGGRVTASAVNAPATGCPRVFFLVDDHLERSAPRAPDGAATARLRLDDSLALGRHRVAAGCSARAADAFATTSVTLAGTRRSAFVRAVVTPATVSTNVRVLAGNALLALLIVVLVAFPAELFNNTLDANYEEVTGWWAPWRRRLRRADRSPSPMAPAMAPAMAVPGGPHGAGAASAATAAAVSPARERWLGRARLLGFLLAGGVIYGLLDPGFGLNEASVALVVGLVAGLLAVIVASGVSTLFYVRRHFGERGRFEWRPASIAVALVCVLLSRLLHFQPGYLFGLLGGYAIQRELPRDSDGALTAAGAVVMLLAGALAWLVWLPVSHRAALPGAGLAVLAADAALAAVFVASIEALAIGLLPLRFLNGSRVMAWSRPAWAALFGVSVFIFVHALLHPEDGYTSTSPRSSVFGVVALAAAFGLASVLFWSYFRFRRPRATTRIV